METKKNKIISRLDDLLCLSSWFGSTSLGFSARALMYTILFPQNFFFKAEHVVDLGCERFSPVLNLRESIKTL